MPTNPNMPPIGIVTAKVKSVSGYWKQRIAEAIDIRLSEGTMNWDNSL